MSSQEEPVQEKSDCKVRARGSRLFFDFLHPLLGSFLVAYSGWRWGNWPIWVFALAAGLGSFVGVLRCVQFATSPTRCQKANQKAKKRHPDSR